MPCNGLAQYDFLYCDEYDTRKAMQTILMVKGGKVVWTYEMPIDDHNHVMSKFDEVVCVLHSDTSRRCPHYFLSKNGKYLDKDMPSVSMLGSYRKISINGDALTITNQPDYPDGK